MVKSMDASWNPGGSAGFLQQHAGMPPDGNVKSQAGK